MILEIVKYGNPVLREKGRVEEAPAIQRNSRLSCQCELRQLAARNGPIVVRVPAWNRNAVKEIPH